MTTLDLFLQRCHDVTADPPGYVAEWKAKHPGHKAVGFFPTYVPPELAMAAGALPVGIWGGPIHVSRANAHLQQFTCSIVRSATEYALRGDFDGLDVALFPPVCDSAKLTAGIWKLNLPKTRVDMVNLPERLHGRAPVAYLASELRRVVERLSRDLDTRISTEALRSAIRLCNEVRRLQAALYERRLRHGLSLRLADVCAILRAGTILDIDEYLPQLRAAVDAVGGFSGRASVPVVVTGLACQLPSLEFLSLFEEAGLRVMSDDLFLGMRGVGEVASGGNPLVDLAEAYTRGPALATRHHAQRSRHTDVIGAVRESRSRGVVLLVPKCCEPEWFDRRYLQQEFQQAGIPSIVIDFDETPGLTAPVLTRLEAFAETLS